MPRISVGERPARRGQKRLTCANCRSRKMKCDSTQPQCRICLAYGDQCHYDKPPPMSQILAMASRIDELERRLGDSGVVGSSETPSYPVPAPRKEIGDTPTPSTHQAQIVDVLATGSLKTSSHPALEQQSTPQYLSTSAIHDPTDEDNHMTASLVEVRAQTQSSISIDEQQLDFWEGHALDACAIHLQLPRDKVMHLLTTHWTWVHTVFMFVSKPTFLRDAACGGPHFSVLLLTVICLHSTRFTDLELGENLLSRVHLLLGRELPRETSVPTIQALLQLSAREIGKGNLSQAWLYSGMAFRMAVDIGIFSAPKAVVQLGGDRLVREQLAWSCYLWDKAVALYLGRSPVLPEAPNFDPPTWDDSAEQGWWSPYNTPDHASCNSSPIRSYTISCFANFCRLATIINDILFTVYTKKLPADVLPFLQHTQKRLEVWRSNSPAHLVVETSATSCPPPHIVTQNLLYHATIILLHRPFRGNTAYRMICRHAADAVENLFLLMENAHGLSHVTYLMAYCAYTAATIAVMDIRDGVEGSRKKYDTYLRALYGVRPSCPGMQQSINILVKVFDTRPVSSESTDQISLSNAHPHQFDILPAFPSDQFYTHGQTNFVSHESLPFGELDPFAYEWSTIPIEAFNAIEEVSGSYI